MSHHAADRFTLTKISRARQRAGGSERGRAGASASGRVRACTLLKGPACEGGRKQAEARSPASEQAQARATSFHTSRHENKETRPISPSLTPKVT